MEETKFNHPYDPYEIQIQFMESLYSLLTGCQKVGIFESPTGTGKTLSLMCPSVTWLRNLDKIKLQERLNNLETLKGPPFVKVAAKKKLLKEFQDQGDALKLLAERSQNRITKRQVKKKRFEALAPAQTDSNAYVLEDPLVDLATDKIIQGVLEDNDPLLDRLVAPKKIFFTSRTHSQLTQFVDALKNLRIEASWSDSKQPLKHVPLGSRKQLCNNPEVSKAGSIQNINDQCSDLRKKHACSYFKNNQQELTEEIITNVMDIEDLYKAGKYAHSCSYYAAREAVAYAEVVTLPYQLIVDSSTRKTLGIDIKDSLIIIDEAHNIMDVINSLNSSSISHQDVKNALRGLMLYKDRLGRRLSTRNSTKLSQTIAVVESLNTFFEESAKLPAKQTAPGSPIPVSDLFKGKNAETINLWELKDWFDTSKLVFKIDGYVVSEAAKAAPPTKGGPATLARTLVLGRVVDFITLASDPSQDGKLFFDKNGNILCISFLSLDPSQGFEELVDKAAKVVLAGGTMEPMSDYTENLIPKLPNEQLVMFSCGHIVPPSHLMVRVLDGFEFTFANRSDNSMIERLGDELQRLIKVIPAGTVVFFPSYSYLDQVTKAWKASGKYGQMNSVKKIFTEDKTKTAESILDGYAKHIGSGVGALMFAVVGGKLSEGINFSDDLARGVMMIGLPFPNAFSAEMVAKKEYIEARELAKGRSQAEASQAAREQYENLSMRAVNQSVGRAIRHIKDYSAIYLVDTRYQHSRIKDKLSGWLRDAVQVSPRVVEDTRVFFEAKKKS